MANQNLFKFQKFVLLDIIRHMKQIYFHSKAGHIDLHDAENSDESESEPESTEASHRESKCSVKHIFDLKSQSRHLPTDKLIDLYE